VSKPVAQKLQRWALQIQKFNYEIEHISGEDNVWSDLMTRWGAIPVTEIVDVKAVVATKVQPTLRIPDQYRIRPLQQSRFTWPSVEEIKEAQQQHLGHSDRKNSDNLITTKSGKVIIPLECKDLIIRLCIIAHAGGNSGHLGYKAASEKLAEHFYWPNLNRDMHEFCRACLHCLPTRGGVRIPRPLGEALHGQYPNHVVHMDWIYIMPADGKAWHKYQWNFIMRDDLSGFVQITPAVIPDTLVTVDALMEWRAASRTPELIVTDMASYFMSAVMQEFETRCNIQHHFTVAYGHYSNGSIEVINRHYLALIRALISELHWNKQDWPWLNKNVEHTLNHRPQSRLNWKAPVTVFTGQPADNPFDYFFRRNSLRLFELQRVSPQKIQVFVDTLQTALSQMHKQVSSESQIQRKKKRIQPRVFRKEPNFQIGDFVLVADPDPSRRPGKKLFLMWKGPYKVTDTLNNYIFEVENIINGSKQVVHGDRIQYYCDEKLNITEQIKDQFAYDSSSYEVSQFRDCRINPQTHEIEFLVDWKGFSQSENTWEPLQNLRTDVPALVAKYIEQLKREGHALADAAEAFVKMRAL
jgi:hypothetical protein